MEFCPRCDGLMFAKEGLLICDKCHFSRKQEKKLVAKEPIKNSKKGSGVSDGKNKLATFKHSCKKCGYDRVEIIDMGIFISDEDNLILLKCGKCGWSERIGRKVA